MKPKVVWYLKISCSVLLLLVMMWGDKIPLRWDEMAWMAQTLWPGVRLPLTFSGWVRRRVVCLVGKEGCQCKTLDKGNHCIVLYSLGLFVQVSLLVVINLSCEIPRWHLARLICLLFLLCIFRREKTRSDPFVCQPLRSGFPSWFNACRGCWDWLSCRVFLCRTQEPESHDEVWFGWWQPFPNMNLEAVQ